MSYVGTPGGFGLNGNKLYTNVSKPMVVNLQYTVTPTNGLGVTSLKSNGYVNNVFMHTSTTAGSNNGFTNPNPANGYAWIQLKNNFNYFLAGMSGFVSKNSGSDVKIDNSAMTTGAVYVITTLGNATAAKWLAIGVPVGVTPAVGVSFVALSNGGAGNTLTSRVQVPSVSGISGVEIVGTTNTMVNSNVSSNAGQWVMVQFLAPSFTAGAYTPAGTVAAPTFTGSALAAHRHSLFVATGATDATGARVNAATDSFAMNNAAATISGIAAASGSAGGVVDITAGTPAGTNSAPAFTGSAASLTGTVSFAAAAPATGSLVYMQLVFDGSSVTIDGL